MRLLCGTQSASLITACLSEIGERQRCDPSSRSILLVPEQTKMNMEQAFLRENSCPALMFTEILSFRRLAWRLLGEVGLLPAAVVDPVGQAMLIHKVLRQNQDQLLTFGHLADKPGFIREAAAVIGDLKRYDIRADDLTAAAQAAADLGLRNKAHDLAVLLRAYDDALQETSLADAEDDLNRLAVLMATLESLPAGPWPWPWQKLSWLRRTAFWITGFAQTRDFTPQEDKILAALNRLGEAITVTCAADLAPADPLAVDAGADCFLNGRKAAWRLLQSFPECRVDRVSAPLPGIAARVAAAMRGQESLPAIDGGPRLRLVQCDGQDDELAWVAAEIRRLVQREGYRYKDFSLAICGLAAASPRLKAVFREFGIPLFLDAERPLGGTPLARLVLGLLDIGLAGWGRQPVMVCLRSGLVPLAPDDIDHLENAWLAAGMFRPGRLFDDRLHADPALPGLRDRALQAPQEFLTRLKETAGARDKCALTWSFLFEHGVPARIQERSAQLAAGGETESAVTLVQSWNELGRIFEQMGSLSGDLPLSLQAFRDMLAAGLDSVGSGVIPTVIDQVTAGDLKRAMLRPCRVLFLIGATAAQLPPALPPEGLLKDQDRQSLSAALNRQLPSSLRDQVFADAFNLYTLLTLPSDHLILTSPENETAAWFERLAAMQPDARLRPAIVPRPETGGQAACQAARLDERIEPELVRAFYGEKILLSVSQLENYASCPYRHWAITVLALQEREIWQPQNAETGTLLHGAAELALRDLAAGLQALDPADREGRVRWLQNWISDDLAGRAADWLRQAAGRENLQRFFEPGLLASAGRRSHRQITASLAAIGQQYQHETCLPAYLEWVFGPGQADSLVLGLPGGGELSLRGKVDRIDWQEDPDGAKFRVVDYKSGSQNVDLDSLYAGLSLQLPVYLAAFAASHPACRAWDAAYFRFDRPIVRLPGGKRPTPEKVAALLAKSFGLKSLGFPAEDVPLLLRHTLRQVHSLAAALLGGDIRVRPRKFPGRKAACSYCPMLAVCGFDGQPAGYELLPLLRGRADESGKRLRKRQELIIRLHEAESREGGGSDAADT